MSTCVNKPMKLFRGESGMSLVSVLIAGAVTSGVIAGFSVWARQQAKFARTMELLANRTNTFNSLNNLLRSPNVLFISFSNAASDSMFRLCLNNDPGTPSNCIHRAGKTQSDYTEFVVFRPTDGTTTGSAVEVTGGNASYTPDGALCLGAANADCPMVARAFFAPICEGEARKCPQAQQFRLVIRYAQEVESSKISGPKIQAMGLPWDSPFIIDTAEILSAGARTCAANQVQSGWDQSGKPICTDSVASAKNAESANNALVSDSAATVNYTSRINGGSCPGGWVVRGINRNGTPSCQPPQVLPAECPPGSRMTGVAPSGSIICRSVANTETVYAGNVWKTPLSGWLGAVTGRSVECAVQCPDGFYISTYGGRVSGGRDLTDCTAVCKRLP